MGDRSWAPDARAPWLRDAGVGVAAAAAFLVAWLGGGSLWQHVNSGDLHGIYLPWFEYVARAFWQEHRVPLWQPWQYFGTPAIGIGHPAAMYPFVLLLFGGLLSSWTALQAFYALHVAILGAGMSAVLRASAVGPVPAFIATLAVVATLFRGPMLAAVDHPSFLAATAWLPWMLFCWQRAMTGPMLPWTAGIAGGYAMQWFAGYPDFPLDYALLLGLVVVIADDGPLVRRVGVLLLGLALGTALAAPQVLVLGDVVPESIRSEEGDLQRTIRAFFGVGGPMHVLTNVRDVWGPAAIVLAGLALLRPERRRLAWAAAFVWSAFALNRPFAWLYEIPPWSGIRFPFGWGGGVAVFLGLLAATGMSTTWSAGRRRRVVAAVLGVVATGWALVVIERAPSSLPPFSPGNPEYAAPDVERPAERARLLAAAAGSERVLAERDGRAGNALRYRFHVAFGHEPSVLPRRIVHLLAAGGLWDNLGLFRDRDWQQLASRPVVATILGIRLVAIGATRASALEKAGFRRIGTLPGGDVLLEWPAHPRAGLAHRAEVAPDGEAGSLAAVLRDPLRPPDGVVLDEGSEHPPIAEPPPDARESARIVSEEDERIVIEATAAAPALLVLRDTWYPGWHAEVDGMPAPILRADHAFRAVWVPAGRHDVVFTYAPTSFRVGVAIAACALLIVAGFLTAGVRWRSGPR